MAGIGDTFDKYLDTKSTPSFKGDATEQTGKVKKLWDYMAASN